MNTSPERVEPGIGTPPRLDGRDLRFVSVLALLAVLVLPWWASRGEPASVPADYRVPHSLSEDVWQLERWAARASEDESAILVFGDSVVWGEFAPPLSTLSAQLARRIAAPCANLGLPGLHPLALEGLLRHHTPSLHHRRVVLVANLLWSSSAERDLSASEVSSFNHAGLVPQFDRSVTAYGASFSDRVGALLERHVELLSWVRHVRATRFEGLDPPRWTIENPRKSVISQLSLENASDAWHVIDAPRQVAQPWTDRGLRPQSFEWLELEASLQWRAIERSVSRLRRDGCRVLVVVWPLNGELLDATSRETFEIRREDARRRLASAGVRAIAPAAPPSGDWADLSHPLAAGYARIIDELVAGGSPFGAPE